jgi:hypothetical protein
MRGTRIVLGTLAMALVVGCSDQEAPVAPDRGTGQAVAVLAHDPTVLVDDDGVQCPSATFTTIGAAVAAANPGDVIGVCPGTYNESVVVDKPLVLEAQGRGASRIDCFDPQPPDPTRDAIVQGGPSPLFSLAADDVSLLNFVVQNNAGGNGIETNSAFSGYDIRNNVVQNNTSTGLVFHASGASPSLVANNCFRTAGLGIRSASFSGPLQDAVIRNNDFFQNAGGGIFLGHISPGSLDGVTVANNVSREDAGFIEVGGSQDTKIANNRIFDSADDAIVVDGDNVGLVVRANRLSGGALDGIAVIDFLSGGGGNQGLNIVRNRIDGFAGSGIIATPEALFNSKVVENRIEDNDVDGIRLAVGNDGNRFTDNVLDDNGEHDCHDETAGGGTAGTANIWRKNQGDTATPPGICR